MFNQIYLGIHTCLMVIPFLHVAKLELELSFGLLSEFHVIEHLHACINSILCEQIGKHITAIIFPPYVTFPHLQYKHHVFVMRISKL